MLDKIKLAYEKISNYFNKKSFKRVANGIYATPPVDFVYDESVVIVSQVYHGAMDMSLIALKSFMTYLGRGAVEVIDDGSLTDADKQQLYKHIPKVKIIPIKSIQLNSCPAGGCWERLAWIIQRSETAYVVQVDTDTITSAPISEIVEKIQTNTGFTIGNPMWSKAVSFEYMNHITKVWKTNHVQTLAESRLQDCQSVANNRYLRGCAAFAGFPKGKLTMEYLDVFSQEMEYFVGKNNWKRWGTEQFSSNVMISQCPKSEVLPWPKYQNFYQPQMEYGYIKGTVSLIHFIGTNRYKDRVYEKMAANYIKTLK